jgi:hypothetical protein
MLDHVRGAIVAEKLDPILAAEYQVQNPDKEIHHDALYLLHACRLAVFELSEYSGALMEIERAADYGTLCLILYEDPAGSGWRLSRMLSSFVEEHPDRCRMYGYVGVDDAREAVHNWIGKLRRHGHV